MADRAQPVPRFGDGDALPSLGGRFENAEHVAIDLGRRAFSRSAVVLSISACRLGHLGVEDGALGGHFLFGGLQLGLALLDPGVELVGLHHDFENAILARADVVLRGLDLVEHRRVFAVGLHLEQLVLVFREPRLDAGDFLLFGPPFVGRGGQPRLDAADRVAGGLQPRVERLRARRVVGDLPPRLVGGGFELLQADQAVRSGFIEDFATNKKSPARGLADSLEVESRSGK